MRSRGRESGAGSGAFFKDFEGAGSGKKVTGSGSGQNRSFFFKTLSFFKFHNLISKIQKHSRFYLKNSKLFKAPCKNFRFLEFPGTPENTDYSALDSAVSLVIPP